MESRYDICALGEFLIDFAPSQNSPSGSLAFTGNPGGAPANLLIAATKLGLSASFITKVGDDVFGELLKKTLDDNGVDSEGLITSKSHPTTLAFVSLDSKGDRSFSFYRHETADVCLSPEEVHYDLIASSRMFHFGSVAMSTEPARSANFAAAKFARDNGIPVSFDPNLRIPLWNDLTEAKRVILEAMHYADYVKLSDYELAFLTESPDIETGVHVLSAIYDFKFLCVTLGENGCMFSAKQGSYKLGGYKVDCVDTTGAGDAFYGCLISQLVGKNIESFSYEELCNAMRLANAAGALTTLSYGAIPALPDVEQIKAFFETNVLPEERMM